MCCVCVQFSFLDIFRYFSLIFRYFLGNWVFSLHILYFRKQLVHKHVSQSISYPGSRGEGINELSYVITDRLPLVTSWINEKVTWSKNKVYFRIYQLLQIEIASLKLHIMKKFCEFCTGSIFMYVFSALR